MMKYEYYDVVKKDIRQYIVDNEIDINNIDIEVLESDLWVADSVTGNASGSYYCNAWIAEESIAHNLDLFIEACEWFGCDAGAEVKRGTENMDVLIRCYVLATCLDGVIEELKEGNNEAINN